MTQTNTNAAATALARHLAAANSGTFTGLIYRKKGQERGSKGAKVRFGDDLVHAVLYTGFRYETLVQRSLDALPTTPAEATSFADEIVGYCVGRNIVAGNGNPITHGDVEQAVNSLRASFESTLAGTSQSTTSHVYEPLMVNGETVRGARVYRCVAKTGMSANACQCRECSGDRRAPVDGQTNILGLLIGEQVLEAAPNGPIPHAKSRGDVVAKRVIRKRLAIGRVRSYSIAPGDDTLVRAGGAAETLANENNVVLDADEIRTAAALLAS
jgi:hypothetical protein